MTARPGSQVAGSKVQERDIPLVALVAFSIRAAMLPSGLTATACPPVSYRRNLVRPGLQSKVRSVEASRHERPIWPERHREQGKRRG
jgi:hypothetical protein